MPRRTCIAAMSEVSIIIDKNNYVVGEKAGSLLGPCTDIYIYIYTYIYIYIFIYKESCTDGQCIRTWTIRIYGRPIYTDSPYNPGDRPCGNRGAVISIAGRWVGG